jgi:hypothetical protein
MKPVSPYTNNAKQRRLYKQVGLIFTLPVRVSTQGSYISFRYYFRVFLYATLKYLLFKIRLLLYAEELEMFVLIVVWYVWYNDVEAAVTEILKFF